MESNIAKQILSEEEIKRRVEDNSKIFPFSKEEIVYIRSIPYHDWSDIDLAIKVSNMIQVEFFA